MIRPEAYHHAHPMGDSTFIELDRPVDDTEALIYVHVPKNASCWIKYHLKQTKQMLYNYYDQGFDVKKHKALVVLRDPLQRWISAMGQILVGCKPDYYLYIDNLNWDNVTSTILRNNHTQPQHEFFANIPHDRIVWFRCDGHLKETFPNFLKKYNLDIGWLSEDQDVDNQFNMTKKIQKRIVNNYSRPPQQQIVDKIQLVLDQHPEYVDRIKNLYQEDYKLFNNVPYYDTRQFNC
jgi:hypothetical protein